MLLPTISKSHTVKFHVVNNALCTYCIIILGSIMHTRNMEIRECVEWSLTRG